jgi:predicted DNA-binding transcriptional regulator YafY
MEETRIAARIQRLEAIRRYLYWQSHGATVIELARHFEVERSTIYNDIDTLSEAGEPIYQEGSRIFLNREDYLSHIKITLREALALYLAARLLSKQSDTHNPHVVSALDKLAEALGPMYPVIGEHIHQAALSVQQRPTDPGYVRVFEIFARAWADQHVVDIIYGAPNSPDPIHRTIAPYYMEVSGIGFATYIIGHDSLRNQIRTFKLDRIRIATPRPETTFTIPESFDPQDRLGNAWGVMWPHDGEEPTEVRIRFTQQAAWRIRESLWHPSQIIEDLPDGGCRYTVRVGSTVEMRPWIRGWGKDAVVEWPPAFRNEIAAELRDAARNYGSG